MLTIHKIVGGSASGYAAYLTSIEATGDYYVGPDGDPFAALGEWLGGLAGELGLAGSAVERAALLAVLDGCDPWIGERLVGRWRADRVEAHDLVFSAPSSVTDLWVLVDDELRGAIQRAQDEAVAVAVAYIERNFNLVRRRDRGQMERAVEAFRCRHGREPTPAERQALPAPIVSEPAAAILAATFSHHTSRQTAAQAKAGVPPDPQLHTHALLPGVIKRRDGQYVALNSLELHQRREEAGAVYRASLAAGLVRLGFAIERRTGKAARYFEVVGIPVALRQLWSSRHQEAQSAAEECRQWYRERLGREPTIVEERQWAAKGRAPKGRYYRADLFRFWRDAAAQLGVTPDLVEDLRRPGVGVAPPQEGRAQLIAELLSGQGITREHATFDMRALRREAYERAAGLIGPADVEHALADLLRHDEVIEVSPGVWTTREILELEKRVLAWQEARAPSRVGAAVAEHLGHRPDGPPSVRPAPRPPALSPRIVEEVLLRCPVRLSDEQRSALDQILNGRFTALTGEAGTGKGVVLRVAADVWRRQGRRILAVAVGGAQAQRLAADLGPGVVALTLDSFTWRVEHGYLQLRASDVVALDEAGQVDSRRWDAFTRATGSIDTVVALGDHAQISPIAAGGLWPLLAKGGPQLSEVRRTKLTWERDAWAYLRQGESAKALELYGRRGHLELHATPGEALDAAVATWDREGRDGLIVTLTSNVERHRANLQAQGVRWVRGELGAESVTATAGSGAVRFHAGDPVLFTTQYRRPEMARRVENGTTAQVIGVDPVAQCVRVRTSEASPRELVIPVGEGQSCIDLYYACHVVKSQGTTVRKAYVVAGGWQTSRETLYVACSRAREGTRLFVDRESLGSEADADALVEMVRRSADSRAKLAALEGKLPRRAVVQRGYSRSQHGHRGQRSGGTGVRQWHVRAHVLGSPTTQREPAVVGAALGRVTVPVRDVGGGERGGPVRGGLGLG